MTIRSVLADVGIEKTMRKKEAKMDIVDLSLKAKYWKKFNKCKSKILARYSDLKEATEYIFISEASLSRRLKIEKVNLERKAWCKGNKIYIGEIVLMQNEDDLIKVILHELLHINYPHYSEDEVIEETNKRMGLLLSGIGIMKQYINKHKLIDK